MRLVFLSAVASVAVLAFMIGARSTSSLQAQLNRGQAELACGDYWTDGLKITKPAILKGASKGCVTLHITAPAPALSCRGVANGQVEVSGITFEGTARGISSEDINQDGIELVDCPNVSIRDVIGRHLNGAVIDCAAPSSDFHTPSRLSFTSISGSHRGYHQVGRPEEKRDIQ